MVQESLREMVERYDVGRLLSRAVLMVDDEPENLDVLEALLQDEYRVFRAGSGAEALALSKDHAIDVIVADQRMPGMTGVELLEQVGQVHPDIAGIILTAYTDSPAIMSAINRAQVFRFLTKPFDAEVVLRAVVEASDYVYQHRAIAGLVSLLSTRNDELARALDGLQAAQQQVLHMERLGTMGRLASGVTHDLRNFLMGLAYLETEVESGGVSDEIRESVQIGLSGLRNLLNTLESMNQFARSGRLGVALGPVNPASVVRDAVTVMRMDMEFRRRKLDLRLDPDLPEVLGDPRKLTQALVNLVRNAVQATQHGDTLVVEAVRHAGGGVELAIGDSGRGVPPEIREHLFQPFMTSKGDGGMGMGLYMARLVAESHGGRIECTDRPGGGTRFVVILPPAEPTGPRAN